MPEAFTLSNAAAAMHTLDDGGCDIVGGHEEWRQRGGKCFTELSVSRRFAR